jgi:RNA polymerase sigma factor (sigma-70 family)
MTISTNEARALVLRAADGDRQAWDELVSAYAGLIWSIARSYRLSAAEAADVSQTTWLRLCENIGRLRDPSCVGAWLATTARRECLSLDTRRRTVVLVDDLAELDVCEDDSHLDDRLIRQEQVAEVRRAMHELPGRTRTMLQLLMQDEPPSYEELASSLQLPVGSIGPTRGRALRKLRHIMEATAAAEAANTA